jgi:hypothetical protein
MEQYAVVTYDGRHNDNNEIEILHITDNYDYANKLAFQYAKEDLPKSVYGRTEYRILKNYFDECNTVILRNVIVEYRIGEVEYDDECEEYEKYDFSNAWNIVWAVVKINNKIDEIKDIDETIIYEC